MDIPATAKAVIKGLGGAANIKTSEPCITRIRCTLVDKAKVDEAALKKAGAVAIGRLRLPRLRPLPEHLIMGGGSVARSRAPRPPSFQQFRKTGHHP